MEAANKYNEAQVSGGAIMCDPRPSVEHYTVEGELYVDYRWTERGPRATRKTIRTPATHSLTGNSHSHGHRRLENTQAKKYEKSAFGGVDVWLILGLMVFVVPFGGLAVGYATGYIHTM